ncbi:hypothetical protein HHK36_005830 [Tetracentron sinense]|uniref:Uncharacterized protein n=1 Tax=Tetracentron sinense TaxID=13715 RepID=A0A834ZM43_TETSI|nr:hypothetical protein HHK36_005830 [Tetracentron sinense]
MIEGAWWLSMLVVVEECHHDSEYHSDVKKVLPNDVDLLNPPADLEKRTHKLKRLVQTPNSFFMVVQIAQCLLFFLLMLPNQSFSYLPVYIHPSCRMSNAEFALV